MYPSTISLNSTLPEPKIKLTTYVYVLTKINKPYDTIRFIKR